MSMDDLSSVAVYDYNSWTEHSSFVDDLSPISCVEYDNYYDMVWLAHANGRLTSYSFTDEVQFVEDLVEENMFMPTPPSLVAFSSFPAAADAIVQLLPNHNCMLAVSCSRIRMITHGGAGVGSWTINHCPSPVYSSGGITMLSSAEAAFTCADLIRDPTLPRGSSAFVSSSLVAGTTAAGAYLFDLTQSIDSPVMVFNVTQPTIKIQSNGHCIVAAGQDGCLRILDGKFRSTEVSKSIEAHSGSIRDVCMQADGRTLITCGTSKRAINPYDPKSPYHYSNDLQIRVFDLRMHRMITPLQVAVPSGGAGVSCVRLLPQVDTDPVEYPALLVCTDDGVVQVSNLDVQHSAQDQVLYPPLSTAHEVVTAAAVSQSGQYLALGTSGGAFGQYVKPSMLAVSALHERPEGMKSTELYRVNEVSPHAKTGPARDVPPPAPLLSLSVDSPVLGTAYVLNTPPHATSAMLSSSFAMTPAMAKRKLRLVPTCRISEELLSKTSARQEFIRIIPNPGYRPNSMKNVPKASTTLSASGATLRPPYAVCDPRKLQILQQQQAAAQKLSGSLGHAGHAAGTHSTGATGGAHPLQRTNSRQGDGHDSADEGSVVMVAAAHLPPKLYLKSSSSNQSKQRFKKFNYAIFNDSPFVGLENNVPNSLINPILQLCYSLSPLRDQALLSQLHPFHFEDANQSTVVCEMGFLFHMMRLVEEHMQRGVPEVDKVVRAANFQRVFQTLQLIPEAVALSLFDEGLQSDLQQFIQIFVPFLLRLLLKEIDQENASVGGGAQGGRKSRWNNQVKAAAPGSNAVDDLFGYSTLPSTTFLHSGVHKVDPKLNRSLVLDLIYPSLISVPGTGGPNSSKRSGGPTKSSISPVPSTANLSQAAAPSSASKYKVTGRKSRTNASFAAVLWGSFQREVSMKGWCSESEAFEPFKKVHSLVSLPKVLSLLCGNTQADVKDSTTLAGALGETIGQGSTHSNYWSHPVLVTASADDSAAAEDPLLGVPPGGNRQYAWLPLELEVAYKNGTEKGSAASLSINAVAASTTKLIISCRCVPYCAADGHDSSTSCENAIWICFDGTQECVLGCAASDSAEFEFLCRSQSLEWTVQRFQLSSLVLQVTPPPPAAQLGLFNVPVVSTANVGEKKHLVLQLNKSAPACNQEEASWFLFNDFIVQKIPVSDIVSFPTWKHPCIVSFDSCQEMLVSAPPSTDSLVVPASVLQLESMSRTPSIRLLQSFATLPGPGDLIAFDGEFVSVSLEKSIINAAGERIVSEEVRQVLARISLLDMGHGPRDTEGADAATASPGSADGPGATAFNKNMMRIIADDYILPVEPVLDYVTRFSGITEEDLNPITSKHSILSQRAAYLKLRYFIDAKCVFVGHGLQKDFETANIFVPPEQIRDTVELWRLPNQRKISLRFLASYILQEDIQDEIHDSIEDAKTSLLLYRKYKAVAAQGPEKLNAVLQDLYMYGNRNNWTIGMDKLDRHG